jgi:ubiquitin-like-conjugating enzyme ATG10
VYGTRVTARVRENKKHCEVLQAYLSAGCLREKTILRFATQTGVINVSRESMLPAFPHLTDSEFEDACSCLVRRFQSGRSAQNDWLSMEKLTRNEVLYLRIIRPLPRHAESSDDENELGHDEVTEDDGEVLTETTTAQPTITYDIILSPTYRVPVLYINIQDIQHRYPPTMKTLYEHLVPTQFKPQTENVGVMGGVTVTDHPVTYKPVFFIHPCRTAEVMEASVEPGRNITAGHYLIIWIGSLGKSVGLNVPLALATQNDEKF